jgi:hypothetical protein
VLGPLGQQPGHQQATRPHPACDALHVR